MKNPIKKIELDLGGKIVSLTPEQAKNLKEALDELFGKEIVKEYVPIKEYIPYPYTPYTPYYPWYWQPTYWLGDANIGTATGIDTGYASNCSFDSGTLRLTG